MAPTFTYVVNLNAELLQSIVSESGWISRYRNLDYLLISMIFYIIISN